MRHAVPWSVKGVDAEAREAAKEAAHRAGMTLGEWLNAVIAGRAPVDDHDDRDRARRRMERLAREIEAEDRLERDVLATRGAERDRDLARALAAVDRLAEVSQRQAAAMARVAETAMGGRGPARATDAGFDDRLGALHGKLASLSAKLDRIDEKTVERFAGTSDDRLDRLSNSLDALEAAGDWRAEPRRRSRPEPLDADLDDAVAEIARRQRALDADDSFPVDGVDARLADKIDALSRQVAALSNAARDETQAPRGRDRGERDEVIVRELQGLSKKIDAYGRPTLDGFEKALKAVAGRIEAVRREVAARPGEAAAVEGLRSELSALGEAIAETAPRRAVESMAAELRDLSARLQTRNSGDQDTRAVAEALADVRDALARMTPAPDLSGDIEALARKIDFATSRGVDPISIERLQEDLRAIRSLVSESASRDSVSALAADIRALGARIDILPSDGAKPAAPGLVDMIEARIDEIAKRIGAAQHSVPASNPQLETALRLLTEKLSSIESGRDESAALGEIEKQIVDLAGKIDASDQRLSQLGAIERGLSDLFVQLEEMRASTIDAAERAGRKAARDAMTRRDGEFDARAGAPAPTMTAKDFEPTPKATAHDIDRVGDTLERAARTMADLEPAAPPPAPTMPKAEPRAPESQAAKPAIAIPAVPTPATEAVRQPRPLAPNFQSAGGDADLPLEPGRGAPRLRPPPAGAQAPAGARTDFIAAARRAAQAAAAESAATPPAAGPVGRATSLLGRLTNRAATKTDTHALDIAPPPPTAAAVEEPGPAPTKRAWPFSGRGRKADEPDAKIAPEPPPAAPSIDGPTADGAVSALQAKRKVIVMGIAVALIVIAAGASLLGPVGAPQSNQDDARPAPTASERAPAPRVVGTSPQQAAPPAETPPEPARQSAVPPRMLDTPVSTGSVAPPPTQNPAALPPGTTISPTGWQPTGRDGRPAIPAGLPQRLTGAAQNGDVNAMVELANRFLEGRGVTVNVSEAARLYLLAAERGNAVAQFRLGSMFEKGTGVQRDVQRARDLYEQASAAGNGKAMHNLAVLFAQGALSERPDYRTAASWFRRAAEHGVADSQYNLAILFARGLGVDQNMSESYRWFALAAQSGDQDAAKKRDEIGARLDQQSMVAARLAVQTFAPRPEPEAAVAVPAPPGGWGDEPRAAQQPRRANAQQR